MYELSGGGGGGKVKSIALGRFSILEPRKRDFVRFKKN